MSKSLSLYLLLFIIVTVLLFYSRDNKSTIIKEDIFAINDTSMINTIFMADRYGNTKSNAKVKAETIAKKHGLVKEGGQNLSKRFKKNKDTGLY